MSESHSQARNGGVVVDDEVVFDVLGAVVSLGIHSYSVPIKVVSDLVVHFHVDFCEQAEEEVAHQDLVARRSRQDEVFHRAAGGNCCCSCYIGVSCHQNHCYHLDHDRFLFAIHWHIYPLCEKMVMVLSHVVEDCSRPGVGHSHSPVSDNVDLSVVDCIVVLAASMQALAVRIVALVGRTLVLSDDTSGVVECCTLRFAMEIV